MKTEDRTQKAEYRIPSPQKKHYLTQRHKGHKAPHTHLFLPDFIFVFCYSTIQPFNNLTDSKNLHFDF
jgi:hypothetical protein